MPQLSRELRILYELAQVVARGRYEGGEVMQRVSAEIQSALGFTRALVVRLNEADRTVHAVVQQGIDWPGDEWLPLADYPLLERALRAGGPVLIRDAGAEHAAPARVIERFGVGSIVVVPLLVDGRCTGFIVADRSGERFELDDEDLEVLATLALVSAVFIDKADQYEELRRLDDARSDFISIATHELRTPISVVFGIASTLHLRGDRLESTQVHELRATLFEQTSRLRDLTEQLLDLSKLEAGAIAVAPRLVRPRECVDALLPRIAPDRLRDIEVRIDPELEVVADPDGCERIVGNLVLNALRYGEPPVSVSAELNGVFQLAVEDCGEGVPPEFVPRLFDRFARSDRARESVARGAGLGLAIAQEFARALGGGLRYEAVKPHGARFVLSLPL